MEKIRSFTFTQNCKLKFASLIYHLILFIERKQFKKNLTRKPQVNEVSFQQLNKKKRYYTYPISSWSKEISGINITTPKYIPLKHLPGIGYTLRTFISILFMNISYSIKGKLNKEKLLNIHHIKSPF